MLFVIGVVALNLYAAILVLARAAVYRTRVYRPMLWNILLSIAPIVILAVGALAGAAVASLAPVLSPLLWAIVGLVWLLVLPNASYLITELNLSHRREDDRVPLWYDIILVISLAMSGVMNTVANVFIVHFFVAIGRYGDSAASLTRPAAWIAVGCVMLLLGLGMYLGRYLRVNSWDLKHPVAFLRKVGRHFKSAEHVWACVGFSASYAIFLAIIYLIVIGPVIESLGLIEGILSPVAAG